MFHIDASTVYISINKKVYSCIKYKGLSNRCTILQNIELFHRESQQLGLNIEQTLNCKMQIYPPYCWPM